MRVLGIYGSPRKKGNTDTMLDAFLEGAESAGATIDRLYARDIHPAGCVGCGGCDKKGHCVVDDDMTGVYPLLEQSARIVVASPVYFYGVTGQLKLVIDRTQALFMKKLHAKEKGWDLVIPPEGRQVFFLGAGGTKGKKLFECCIMCMKYFADAINADYAGELTFWRIDARGDIKKTDGALDQCHQAGMDFVKG